MGKRRSGIRNCIYWLSIFWVGSIAFLPLRALAGDMEILIDQMVNQGVITREQGDKMLKGVEETKAKQQQKAVGEQEKAVGEQQKAAGEQEKKGAEQPKVEAKAPIPDWAKNLPDWILNPPDFIKRIRFMGDFRLRYDYLDREPTAAQEAKGTQDFARNRARFRLRFGAETELIDGLKVGFGIATVDPSGSSTTNGNNPRSNMATFNSEFSKKFIGINYAYLAYTAPFLPWVTVSGGKLKDIPFYQANSYNIGSTFLWDQNLTPEGVAIVFNYPDLLNFNGVSLDVFMNNAFFVIDEFGAGSASPYMLGFQPGINLKFMKDFNFKVAAAYYDFYNIKHQAALGFQPTPGNMNTLILIGKSTTPVYAFNYNAFVESAELGYKTPFPSIMPYAGVFGEIYKNTDSHDGGWQGGVRLGYPSLYKFGDWQFSYAYRRLERDAWLDTFNELNFYQGQTNSKGHYIWAGVGVMKHVNATISYYHANSISVHSSVSTGHGITLATPPSPKQPEDRLLVELNVIF